MEHLDITGTQIHVGDTVRFRDRGQDAVGTVTELGTYKDTPTAEVKEEGTDGPYLFYASVLQVIDCTH